MAYTKIQIEDIFNEVIELVESGKPIRQVTKIEGMPSNTTFYYYLY